MRVTCRNVEEFLADLVLGGDEKILQNAVRVTTFRNPIDGTKRDAVKFSVVLQASAVVLLPNEGEYLLEVGEDCGVDFVDATQDFEGSDHAAELKDRIKGFCRTHGLEVRPGLIEI